MRGVFSQQETNIMKPIFNNSRLDDPRYDITATDFHLARDLPIAVNGTELRRISEEVEDALDRLVELPDEQAFGSDLICITSALLGVQQYLQKLEDKFDAAGASTAPKPIDLPCGKAEA
jgi:hypothetical protein